MLDILGGCIRIRCIDINHMHNMNNGNIGLAANPSFEQQLATKYPLDTIRGDITTVFAHYMRTIARVIGADEFNYEWRLPQIELGIRATELFNPDNTAADIELTYEHIRHTALARCMEVLYGFAIHGRLDASVETMTYESKYMWIADLLMDAADGHIAEQWDSYVGGGGTFISESANRCLQVTELANARHILENGEGFSYFSRRRGKKEERNDLDSLTVGQLALLANMEEMSVRAAANPKRATPLQTYTTPEGTRITRDVAKAWLQAKDRYIPVVRYWSAGDVDLQKRRFKDRHDLLEALDQRRKSLLARLETNTLDTALLAAGVQLEKGHDGQYLAFDVIDRFDNAAFMTTLAELLELPAPWLVLRAREAATLARLAEVERELKALSQPPDNKQD
ncbi:hypothetical protein QZM42_34225 [Burkholderia vietnamiensis]|nr:hypothetical protein [Burkholderia vietnamiensis]MBR8284629.1 hypothetical protein [Burkholderia vietnamiensis]MCA8016513.1 hypothetical protein [Burkholderia vietnamiensis]MDN7413581.1 hypothetical protein [Burkholderia vietnamiensis]MDN8071341.1 hypothetical protein [Burkholderia vietnamiensis]UEB98764.1 hypothetical protein LK462_02920 [Burkholderia vietnamiensis]